MYTWSWVANEMKKMLEKYLNVYVEFVILPSEEKINLRKTQSRPGVFILSDTNATLNFIIEVNIKFRKRRFQILFQLKKCNQSCVIRIVHVYLM